MPEVRPIDANALGNYEIEISKDIMKSNPDIKEIFAIFGAAIDRQPTLNYEPVVHAHWIQKGFDCKCSNCGSFNGAFGVKYCQDCGAKMDEEVK